MMTEKVVAATRREALYFSFHLVKGAPTVVPLAEAPPGAPGQICRGTFGARQHQRPV